jgi:AAA15 family ATPase/GTPase
VFLEIKGIGKIHDSKIEMKGITVIAGENNTGKSTFGKALYCMFNSFFDAEKTIYASRFDNIQRIVYDITDIILASESDEVLIKEILSLKAPFSKEKIHEAILRVMDKSHFLSNGKNREKIVNDITDNILQSLMIDDFDIQKGIATRFFRSEFANQINHINRDGETGEITLMVKGKPLKVSIGDNECIAFSDDIGIRHDAIYIDSPFTVDSVQARYRRHIPYKNPQGVHHRQDLLSRMSKDNTAGTVIEEVIIKQKINVLLKKISSAIDGDFREDQDNLAFMEKGSRKPVELMNTSAGIKTFLIIKRLLETGEIKERGVLILDEPEIHLHPEWQLLFAELLVLLEKEFNLTILLTTHSPYFLNAIEVFSNKYDIKDDFNYYLTRINGDTADAIEVTGHIDDIYKQLAEPFQKLENISYEEH